MNLTKEFSSSSLAEWQEKIIKDLKGGTLEDLNWQSELGPVNPVLFDYQNKYARFNSHINQDDNSWLITQSFNCKDGKKANERILLALSGGVNNLHINHLAAEKIEEVFNEVMLDIIHTTIKTTADKKESLTVAMTKYCESKNWNISDLNLRIVSDSIGQYVLNFGPKAEIENGNIFVWGCLYSNCGASIQNEMAFTLAHGHEYLQAQITNGNTPEQAAKNITFQLALGNSYFDGMAKIRAFRTLWNTVLSQYGVENHYTTIHVENSNFYQSNLDLHNNLLRGTTAAMAGILGGADSVEVLRYDQNIDEKRSDSSRMSKNILLILQEEAYFHHVKDATNGAYYIEQLTDIIIEKSWSKFQEIEKMGGFLVAFEKGDISKWVKDDLMKKQEQFKNEELILLGTNKHTNADETRKENYQAINADDKFLAPYRLAQTKLN